MEAFTTVKDTRPDFLVKRREENIARNRKQCPRCPKHFQSQRNLDRHIERVHAA